MVWSCPVICRHCFAKRSASLQRTNMEKGMWGIGRFDESLGANILVVTATGVSRDTARHDERCVPQRTCAVTVHREVLRGNQEVSCRAVDEHVQPSPALHYSSHHPLGVLRPPHVAREGQGLAGRGEGVASSDKRNQRSGGNVRSEGLAVGKAGIE